MLMGNLLYNPRTGREIKKYGAVAKSLRMEYDEIDLYTTDNVDAWLYALKNKVEPYPHFPNKSKYVDYVTRRDHMDFLAWKFKHYELSSYGSEWDAAKQITDEQVVDISQQAFRLCREEKTAIAGIELYCTLPGCGYQLASLVLSHYCPKNIFFMSNQILAILSDSDTYNRQNYERCYTYCLEKKKWLNKQCHAYTTWTMSDVERCLRRTL